MFKFAGTDDEVQIDPGHEELCWRIFTTNGHVRTCHELINQQNLSGGCMLNDDNNRPISDEFIETRVKPYYLPAVRKFNDYITAFGFACVRIKREGRKLYPIILDYGTYSARIILVKGGGREYVCYFRDGEYGWTKPDPYVQVFVENHPTAAGRLQSRMAFLIAPLIFQTNMEMSAAVAEAGRCKPMIYTEARESGLQSDNLRDTDFYTPGDAAAVEANRRSRNAQAGAQSIKVTRDFVESLNRHSVTGQSMDPTTGIPTLDSVIKPQYIRHTYQLPPDQKLVAQQLPLIRPDLVDLKRVTKEEVFDQMGVPEVAIHPAPGARTVAAEEQTSSTFDNTKLYWKKLDSEFVEHVYNSIYGETDDVFYTNLARQFRQRRRKEEGSKGKELTRGEPKLKDKPVFGIVEMRGRGSTFNPPNEGSRLDQGDEETDKAIEQGDDDESLRDSTDHWKQSKFKRPRIHAVFLGIIDASTLHGLFARGLLTPQKYRELLARYLGIPEDTLSLPPICDMKFDRKQQTDAADLNLFVAEESAKAQRTQLSLQKTETTAKVAAVGAKTAATGASKKPTSKSKGSDSSAGTNASVKRKAADKDKTSSSATQKEKEEPTKKKAKTSAE